MRKRSFFISLLAFSLVLSAGCGNAGNISAEESGEITEAAADVTEATEALVAATQAATVATTAAPTTTAAETTAVEETTEDVSGLTALALVPNYVNVRTEPNTESEIVGKVYNYCAAEILEAVDGEDGTWYRISSGNVDGYIKSDFFVIGEEAEEMKESVGVLMGTVDEDWLRVRSEPDLTNDENVFTYYERGTQIYITELTDDGWAKIESDDASAGYVYADCLTIERVFKTAISIEEEEAQLAAKAAAEEAAKKAQEEYEAALAAEAEAKAAEESAAAAAAAAAAAQQESEQAAVAAVAPMDAATSSALRNAVVAYALQFVGNPYVHGGRSLVTGTDCSGFTSLVYQNFGYYLDYTPAGQSTQGTQIPASEAKPGDLLFYSNSQKYLGHVALYIGDGQIVHAGNEASGIIVGSAYYRDPLFAVRIIND